MMQCSAEGGSCGGSGHADSRTKGGAIVDRKSRARRRFKVSGTTFEVDEKYELIKPIGNGAYGVVISALNTETGQKVAIKKVTRAFEDLVDAKRILREIKLLRKFCHNNIIDIVDILVPASSSEFEDVYIVSDLMETDLHRIINSRQELSLDHVQYFLYQVLRALKYMHSSNILHRDLKPSNLLLNSNCDLKICDLGLARDVESGSAELTEYVVTRWYRAPEIMLGCPEYSKNTRSLFLFDSSGHKVLNSVSVSPTGYDAHRCFNFIATNFSAIDMWSVGCIFAELMLRRPYFPGVSYLDQLKIICAKLGKPSADELDFVSKEKARRYIMKLPDTEPRSLRDQFPATATDEALDLLSKMLVFRPGRRISVAAALEHPFMENLHASQDEPVANFELCFRFEEEVLTRHRLKELMWEEMRRYHPEQGPWRGDSSDNKPLSRRDCGKSPSTTPDTSRKFSLLGAELRSSPGVGTTIPPPRSQQPQMRAKKANPDIDNCFERARSGGGGAGNDGGTVGRRCATKGHGVVETRSLVRSAVERARRDVAKERAKRHDNRDLKAAEKAHVTPMATSSVETPTSAKRGRSLSPLAAPTGGRALASVGVARLVEGGGSGYRASPSPCCPESVVDSASTSTGSRTPPPHGGDRLASLTAEKSAEGTTWDAVVARRKRRNVGAARGSDSREIGLRTRNVTADLGIPTVRSEKNRPSPRVGRDTVKEDDDRAVTHAVVDYDVKHHTSYSRESGWVYDHPRARTRATARAAKERAEDAWQGAQTVGTPEFSRAGERCSASLGAGVGTEVPCLGGGNKRKDMASPPGERDIGGGEGKRSRVASEAVESVCSLFKCDSSGPSGGQSGGQFAPAKGVMEFLRKAGITSESPGKTPNMFEKRPKTSSGSTDI